ncbi:MAG: hypothetical protein QOC59_836, partial [Microbacteriaceae bacterium]|nr:hypothetical protein [Microbacteriaceae bacterium]
MFEDEEVSSSALPSGDRAETVQQLQARIRAMQA